MALHWEVLAHHCQGNAVLYIAYLVSLPDVFILTQKLWDVLAEHCLLHTQPPNLEIARTAFVRMRNYQGLQFVKKLAQITDDKVRLAEVAAYYGNYKLAERYYSDADRKDLILDLRRCLGDWPVVLELGQELGNEQAIQEAKCEMGDQFSSQGRYGEAIPYLRDSGNYRKLIDAYLAEGSFEDLQKLARSPLLQPVEQHADTLCELGRLFTQLGMSEDAAAAFVRCKRPDEAVRAACQLCDFELARELSLKFNVTGVSVSAERDKLLKELTAGQGATTTDMTAVTERRESAAVGSVPSLTGAAAEEDALWKAAEVFRRAGSHMEAAQKIYEIAERERERDTTNLARLKKLYVLAALAVEQHRKSGKLTRDAGQALEAILKDDVETATATDFKFSDNPWRGAEAYHYFMLAQKQLYGGYHESAMRTSILCREFTDYLHPVDVYSLLAICACVNRNWFVANQAFIRLEDQQSLDTESKQELGKLARRIFTRYSPMSDAADSEPREAKAGSTAESTTNPRCINCATEIPAWYLSCQNPRCGTPRFPICVASGRLITERQLWQCYRCKRHAMEENISSRSNCPLCHAEKKTAAR